MWMLKVLYYVVKWFVFKQYDEQIYVSVEISKESVEFAPLLMFRVRSRTHVSGSSSKFSDLFGVQCNAHGSSETVHVAIQPTWHTFIVAAIAIVWYMDSSLSG